MSPLRQSVYRWQGRVAALSLMVCAHATAAPRFAVPEAQSISASHGVGSISAVVFGLAVVLALIFGFAWIMRRVQGIQTRGVPIELLAQVSVGQKERLVLVSVAGTRLLVGVANGAVTALHKFEADDAAVQALLSPISASSGTAAVERFRDILQRSLGRK